ncbi:hypothetical protein GCM10010404_89870 [Nonomuraea africana]
MTEKRMSEQIGTPPRAARPRGKHEELLRKRLTWLLLSHDGTASPRRPLTEHDKYLLTFVK